MSRIFGRKTEPDPASVDTPLPPMSGNESEGVAIPEISATEKDPNDAAEPALDDERRRATSDPSPLEAAARPVASDADEPPRFRSLATLAPVIGGVVPSPIPIGGSGPRPAQPSVVMDGVRAGEYHVGAASLVGRAHLNSGTTRQDAYDFVAENGRLVVAIADGLGSRDLSQLGARTFCETVTTQAALDTGSTPEQLLRDGVAGVEKRIEDLGVARRDVAFVAAVAVFDEHGGRIARVGDVSAFVLRDGRFDEAFDVDVDEALNVVSSALPDDVETPPETADLPIDSVCVLCTDGLANDLRNSAQVRAWLADRWQQPSDAFWMADSLRYLRRGSQDDRTGIVVYREERR